MEQARITTLPTESAGPRVEVEVDADGVHITDLFVADPVLAEFLMTFAPGERPAQLMNILGVGVRGLTTMGVGATVKGVGEEVEKVLSAATTEHREEMMTILSRSRDSLAGTLDPENVSSPAAQMLGEIQAVHDSLLDQLDMARVDSHSSQLVASVAHLLGPEGELRRRLDETFDASADDSAAARLLASIDARFRDLHDELAASRGAAEEAQRGTAKGVDYEAEVVEHLRSIGSEIGGCVVEATGLVAGSLDSQSKVGDAVITLPDGNRVVVEAKNAARIGLSGRGGILDELDRAMVNRDAQWAVCVSHEDAFPAEVGPFGIYGNRLLVVDDGEGVLLRAALRWIEASSRATRSGDDTIDVTALDQGLERIRALAQRFSSAKRALSGVRSSVDQVRSELDALRSDLLDLVEDVACALPRSTA